MADFVKMDAWDISMGYQQGAQCFFSAEGIVCDTHLYLVTGETDQHNII
jgi:hypothetical protein